MVDRRHDGAQRNGFGPPGGEEYAGRRRFEHAQQRPVEVRAAAEQRRAARELHERRRAARVAGRGFVEPEGIERSRRGSRIDAMVGGEQIRREGGDRIVEQRTGAQIAEAVVGDESQARHGLRCIGQCLAGIDACHVDVAAARAADRLRILGRDAAQVGAGQKLMRHSRNLEHQAVERRAGRGVQFDDRGLPFERWRPVRRAGCGRQHLGPVRAERLRLVRGTGETHRQRRRERRQAQCDTQGGSARGGDLDPCGQHAVRGRDPLEVGEHDSPRSERHVAPVTDRQRASLVVVGEVHAGVERLHRGRRVGGRRGELDPERGACAVDE